MPDNTSFLIAAFVVIAALIAGYLLFVNSRLSGLRQDLAALRDELDTRPVPAAPAGDAAAAPTDRDGERRE